MTPKGMAGAPIAFGRSVPPLAQSQQRASGTITPRHPVHDHTVDPGAQNEENP